MKRRRLRITFRVIGAAGVRWRLLLGYGLEDADQISDHGNIRIRHQVKIGQPVTAATKHLKLSRIAHGIKNALLLPP